MSALIDFALAIYGLFHTANHIPASATFQALWSALPSVGSVLVFLLGVIAVVIGLWLITHGIQNVCRRIRTVNRIFRDP